MNQKEIKQETTIPKEIFNSIESKIQTIKRFHSAPNLISKNLSFEIPEEENYEPTKESDSDREYKIGNYMVKYTLGQGTFGKVKLGVYIPNDEKVAIKILEKNRITEKDDEIRVKREFDMLAQFSHPNVILVAEIFESEDSYYSVMEFCEGGELFNYIVKKNWLSEDESAFFFYQLINGLEYIHSLGIVHRDLKPENLLLTSEHILKIIDFGLSNYFQIGQENLLSTPCGSPCYASPEMVAGKKYDGFKIDVWACGIILYAMLCGYLPFEDPDNEVLFKKILECKLEYPSYVNRISIDLIEKILVTDPEKRITIPEIKKHSFYLKGKEIFEEGFTINNIVQNPIGKNMSNKNIENNQENTEKPTEKEIIINNNNNKDEVIEIDINPNDNDNEKENVADIGVKNYKQIDINKDNQNNNKIIEADKKFEKKENERKKKPKKRKKNNRGLNENNAENKNTGIKEKSNGTKDKTTNDNKKAKKMNLLKIKINLNNQKNKNEENNNDAYFKNIIKTEKEDNYMPLITEYNNTNFKFNIIENIKEYKEKKIDKSDKRNVSNMNKKINDPLNSKGNNLKKYFELKPKEKSKEKEKEKIKQKENQKEKSADKIRDKIKYKKAEIIKNSVEKKPYLGQNKTEEKYKNQKDITPNKIFFISKNVRSQRPSNIQNLSNKLNVNLKINPKKYLQQKINRLEKLISAKEPKKIKSTFGKMNMNLNINKYNNFTNSQIKGILNTFNSNKRGIDKNKENKEINIQHLKTEFTNINKKNYFDKNNSINKTIDNLRDNLEKTISEVKNSVFKYKSKKKELLNPNVHNNLRDVKKVGDIKSIKSSLNGDNNKTFQILMQNNLGNKFKMIRNKQNSLIYDINNFTNHKSPYELSINNSNNYTINSNLNTNLNTIKTEPSFDIYSKLSNFQKKGKIIHPKSKYIKKTSTNSTNLGFNNKKTHSYKTNLQYRPSYLKKLNSIRKAPTYNLLKTMNLKNIPMTTSEVLRNNKYIGKDRKSFYSFVKDTENNQSKKNQGLTIKNTVINFNMIDTGIILPSEKKKPNTKNSNNKYYNTNKPTNIKPDKKLSKDNLISNNLNTLNTIESINPLNSDNKYNNTINRFSNINNNTHLKPFSNRLNTDNNKISSINSFHQFVNKMKNNQKFNKIQFNNLNNKINSGVNTVNEKNHNKFRSMKLRDYFKTNMPEKKTLEMTGINNINNNLINNSVNHENNSVMNRLTNLNDDKNLTLPSLLSKNKKYIIPKGKGYFINKKGKINKITTYNTIQNNMIGNNNIFEKLNNFH